MNTDLIFTQIRGWLEDDDASPGGLRYPPAPLVSAIAWDRIPADYGLDDLPWLTLSFVSVDNSDDGFDTDVVRWAFDVHGWAKVGTHTLTQLGAIMSRVYGDAVTRLLNTPSHGLHRKNFNVTLADGWAMRDSRFLSAADAHERDVYHSIHTYDVVMSRTET